MIGYSFAERIDILEIHIFASAMSTETPDVCMPIMGFALCKVMHIDDCRLLGLNYQSLSTANETAAIFDVFVCPECLMHLDSQQK